jgi:hypothetical protein
MSEPILLNFRIGKYYLANGMKAEVTNIMALNLQGRVLIPDNIWVPSFWWKDGSSMDPNFNLNECVEDSEEKMQKWMTR